MDIIIKITTVLVLLFSLIPMVKHDHWTFRVFEFPRVQKWVINLIIAIVYLMLIKIENTIDWIFIILLFLNFCYLTYLIFPYLPIASKQIQSTTKDEKTDIKLLIYNVYQFNKSSEKLIELVHRIDADLVLLVETDNWWKNQVLNGFGSKYEHQILEDRENTYGMLVFSKLKLSNAKVRYIIKDEVPSIAVEINLSNKAKVKFYALHPEPPVPGENPTATDRDAELLIVGKEVADEKLPVIVAGDLNDVAWSYTSKLFQKVSGLLDPRKGRGLYSSFHAKYWFLRWPLDHVFCSGHFRVRKMKRLKAIDSDHFPILIELHLSPIEDEEQKLELKNDDAKLAEEKIQAAKKK